MWIIAHNKFVHHVRILDDKIESDGTAPVMHHQCALLIPQRYHELLHRAKYNKI